MKKMRYIAPATELVRVSLKCPFMDDEEPLEDLFGTKSKPSTSTEESGWAGAQGNNLFDAEEITDFNLWE